MTNLQSDVRRRVMELLGLTELANIGTLHFWKTTTSSDLRPNEELSGCIELTCLTPFFLRGIWVKLTGFNTIRLNDHPGGILRRVDLFLNEDDHYLGGIHDVLYGFGEEDEKDRSAETSGALIQLDAGTHKWNYTFKIPATAPYSYCDQNVEVVYTATAFLDSPEVPIAISQVLSQLIMFLFES